MDDNALTEIPDVSLLLQLQVLSLASNNISCIGSTAFSTNTTLTDLKLDANPIASLPPHLDTLSRDGQLSLTISIPDFVAASLYIGDIATASNIQALRSLNITHIVNCAHGLPVDRMEGIAYHFVPIEDTETTEVLPFLPAAVDFMQSAIQNDKGNVLVHCAGIHLFELL